MEPLFYILRKSFKNAIKQLRKKPAALIAYIIFAAFIILAIVASYMSKPQKGTMASIHIYSAISGGIIAAFFYLAISHSLNEGNTFFRMADANFLFTSPISPKRILVYGLIKQAFRTMLFVMLVLFQVPNLKNHFNIKMTGLITIIIATVLLFFVISEIQLLIYTYTSKSNKNKKIAKYILNGILGAAVVSYGITLIYIRNALSAVLFLFDNVFEYVPIIGWFKVAFGSVVKGGGYWFAVNLGLIIIFVILVTAALYKSQTDYYEDVLNATEKVEKVYALKGQNKISINEGMISNKVKTHKISQKIKCYGAKAVFERQLIEYRKTGFWMFDKSTISVLVSGVIFTFILKGKAQINSVLYFSAYMLLFFTLSGKWAIEAAKPYIYLIPAGSLSKVFYATLCQNIKNFIDGIILFAISGIIMKSDLITVILCVIAYVSMGGYYIYADVMARRLFGSFSSKELQGLLKVAVLMVFMLPGVIVSGIIGVIYKDSIVMQYISYLILIGYNIFMCLISMFIGRGIFEKAEYNN